MTVRTALRGAVLPLHAALVASSILVSGLPAQATRTSEAPSWAADPPDLDALVAFAHSESELRNAVTAYSSGRQAMRRSLTGMPPEEATRRERLWYRSWLDQLAALDFDALGLEGKIDYILLRNRVEFDSENDPPGGGQGPIGAEALRQHLLREMIPYSAEELLAIAAKEFAWMDQRLLDASRRMGYGDDWRAAMEAVKQTAVPPGARPGLIRDIAYDSEEFVESRGSVTLPPLMREIWRMAMRGPEGQLTNPFFTGGLQITVSYPTDEMTHDFKLMSMRGNNPHFDRATVHHELIPGHGLQAFMTSRFNSHRQLFATPFWGEGWSLYWEFVLWDQGFPRSPADEIGMLFWRMHRAARIVFSMSYHLGRMTEQEAVDYLVNRVGFERSNAEAEVRRSIGVEPLYQVAYMLGGLQFWSLRKELVESGKMSEREFHDRILQGGRMPVEVVRLRLIGEGLTRDYRTRWRFYGDPLASTP